MRFDEEPNRIVVDNRMFILGLDEMYRFQMKRFEQTQLLECARTVARALGVTAESAPLEGYYAESGELAEYFQLMRAIQQVEDSEAWRVKNLPQFDQLHAVATSGCFGEPEPSTLLLPRAIDALGKALEQTPAADWSVTLLTERARAIAESSGEFSLVALAARTGDPVAVVATRESLVLYGKVYVLCGKNDVYVWEVDAALADAANRFIEAFNRFGADPIPRAEAASAEAYFDAAEVARIGGRCVVIAEDPATMRFYHWAIAGEYYANFHVEAFWEPQVWTTDRYKSQRIIKGGL